MKWLIFIIVCAFISIPSQAQLYKPFKISVTLGSIRENKDGGPTYALEPSFRINDKYAIGLKLEGSVTMVKDSPIKLRGSKSINAQYYFSTGAMRPFAGIGAGMYNVSDLTGCYDQCQYEDDKIGFYPRVGFDYKHLTIVADYNLMSPVKLTTQGDLLSGPSVNFVNGNYLSLRLGITIGGGKKE